MPRYHVTISHDSVQAMRELVTVHKIAVEDHGQRREGGRYLVHAQATPEEIAQLKAAGYSVEQGHDVDAHNVAMREQVGRGNRYKKQS